MTLENLTRESFAENLNTKFRLPSESGESRELELIDVSEETRSGSAERFSIVFRGAPDFFLQQGTYRLEHERLGAFDLFLVAIAREEDGFRYEAVFNRFAKDGEQH
ncbi:MAG: hypothetical protein M3348_14920 [Acidobacteriota bacterium]|nr:hypothetical protein [Acidobacteriota bacterium]